MVYTRTLGYADTPSALIGQFMVGVSMLLGHIQRSIALIVMVTLLVFLPNVAFSQDKKKLELVHTTSHAPGGRVSDQLAIFSPDGLHVLTSSADGKIKLWELQSGRLIRTFPHQSSADDLMQVLRISRDS